MNCWFKLDPPSFDHWISNKHHKNSVLCWTAKMWERKNNIIFIAPMKKFSYEQLRIAEHNAKALMRSTPSPFVHKFRMHSVSSCSTTICDSKNFTAVKMQTPNNKVDFTSNSNTQLISQPTLGNRITSTTKSARLCKQKILSGNTPAIASFASQHKSNTKSRLPLTLGKNIPSRDCASIQSGECNSKDCFTEVFLSRWNAELVWSKSFVSGLVFCIDLYQNIPAWNNEHSSLMHSRADLAATKNPPSCTGETWPLLVAPQRSAAYVQLICCQHSVTILPRLYHCCCWWLHFPTVNNTR